MTEPDCITTLLVSIQNRRAAPPPLVDYAAAARQTDALVPFTTFVCNAIARRFDLPADLVSIYSPLTPCTTAAPHAR